MRDARRSPNTIRLGREDLDQFRRAMCTAQNAGLRWIDGRTLFGVLETLSVVLRMV